MSLVLRPLTVIWRIRSIFNSPLVKQEPTELLDRPPCALQNLPYRTHLLARLRRRMVPERSNLWKVSNQGSLYKSIQQISLAQRVTSQLLINAPDSRMATP